MNKQLSLSLLAVTLILLDIVYCNINGFHETNHTHSAEDLERIRNKYNEKYPKAEDADHLYIHLIPNTHDDVGWLKTVDMYYSGSNN